MTPEQHNLGEAVLGACLMDKAVAPALVSATLLEPRLFGDGVMYAMAKALVAMVKGGRPVDPLTFMAFIREHGVEDKYDWGSAIGPCLVAAGVPGDLVVHATDWATALKRLVHRPDSAKAAQIAQLDEASARMNLTQDSVLTYGIITLAKLRGGWMPGEVDFLAAQSAGGKTTLLTTLTRKWVDQRRKVFYAGFELPASALRLQWAARDAGYVPADIVSGEYLRWPHAAEVREKMQAAIKAQEGRLDQLRCADAAFVTVDQLRKLGRQAAEWGADVFIIDHIDHVEGTGDIYGQSRQAVAAVLEMAKETGVRYLVATQLNQQGLGQDILRSHRPVREEWVKNGGHKKEISTFMFGLARATRRNVSPEELKAVREGRAAVDTIEEPYASQVNVMKHRWYGDRIGKRQLLTWDRGEFTDYLDEQERKATQRVLVRRDLPSDADLKLMA